MSALNFFPPIIKKHVWRTCCCRLPLRAGCWGERRDNTCGLELKHSSSANNLLSLNFKTSPLARAANKLTEDSACTNSRQRGCGVLQRERRAGKLGRLRLKCDVTRAETRFCLSAKRTSPFKSAGMSVQSTTGSRGVLDTSSPELVKSTGYPLHWPVSPSLPLPCVTVCHRVSSGL